jgi:hypothetical protein
MVIAHAGHDDFGSLSLIADTGGAAGALPGVGDTGQGDTGQHDDNTDNGQKFGQSKKVFFHFEFVLICKIAFKNLLPVRK